MSALLCIAPRCRLPGRHAIDCDDEQCRGCLPALAADGLHLCWHCTNRIGPNAVEAAELWAELGLALIGQGAGDGIRSNGAVGINLMPKVVDHRATIRHRLVSWSLLIAEERGIGLPWRWTRWRTMELPSGVLGPLNRVRSRVTDDSTAALGRYVAAHAQWLAGLRELAADASSEMDELVSIGRSLRQASGTRIVQIGPCPQEGEDGPCAGTLRALLRREASLLPSAVTCDANEEHSWDSTQWTKLGRTMAKARAA